METWWISPCSTTRSSCLWFDYAEDPLWQQGWDGPLWLLPRHIPLCGDQAHQRDKKCEILHMLQWTLHRSELQVMFRKSRFPKIPLTKPRFALKRQFPLKEDPKEQLLRHIMGVFSYFAINSNTNNIINIINITINITINCDLHSYTNHIVFSSWWSPSWSSCSPRPSSPASSSWGGEATWARTLSSWWRKLPRRLATTSFDANF